MSGIRDKLELLLFRYATGLMSPQWFLPRVPAPETIVPATGRLSRELVSHCWNYSHLLAYHLSSLVLHPPREIDVTVTVYHAAEDSGTVAMLEYFGARDIPGISWNWRPLPKAELFRRAIGRNRSALATTADWIWYIDCDLIFHEGCLDSLATSLQGRKDALLFPASENITSLLEDANPILQSGGEPGVVDIDRSLFKPNPIKRAVGAYQITHGDIARACGYCRNIRVYQTPTEHWQKTYEDRTYRWLLRTQGERIEIPAIYRIRHISKGRYREDSAWSRLRASLRKLQSHLKGQE